MPAGNDRCKHVVDFARERGERDCLEFFGITSETLRRYERELNRSGELRKRKILLFDIETAPIEAYVWSLWKQNVTQSQIIHDWSVLCWAAKWLDGSDMIESASWRDGTDVRDDRACCIALHALLDEADIVVAHNGDKFDIKRMNARFLKHGLRPPKPFKSVDTLKIAKKKFAISSNRLDYIGEFLGLGRKVKHDGFEMWKGVLAGDEAAQSKMLRYNVGDIVLLEQVYLALRAWDHGHPNVNLDYIVKKCTVCGSARLRRDGEVCTQVSNFAAYQCDECSHWMRGKVNLKDKDDMNRTMRNAI